MSVAQAEGLWMRVGRELSELVAGGASCTELVAALERALACRLWIADGDGTGPEQWLGAVIAPGVEVLGVLQSDVPVEVADRDMVECLEHGARVIGIELVREQAERETRWSLEADLLTELIEAAGDIPERLRQRAAHAGFDLDRRWHVLLLDTLGSRSPSELLAAARRPTITGERAMSCLVGQQLAVAVCADRADAHDAKITDLHRIARGIGATLRVGVSSAVTDFASGLHQAQAALRLAARDAASGTTYHDDMGSLRFLIEAPNRGELAALVDEQVGPLARHDQAHQTYLLETLRVYLEEGGNRRRAAERCHVHVSTIKYRVLRIRELLGRDLADPDVRFDLMLALKILAVLRASGADPTGPRAASAA